MSTHNPLPDQSRRSFITTAVYVAPVILTLKAMPAFASQGSSRGGSQTDNNPVDSGIVEPYGSNTYIPPKNAPGARASHDSGSAGRKRSRWSGCFGLFNS